MTRKRSKLDFYPTPGWAADVLWLRLPLVHEVASVDHESGVVTARSRRPTWAEPCVGRGDLITKRSGAPDWTNDVDAAREATFHRNAASVGEWDSFPDVEWIVTNPPFCVAHHVLRHALAFMRRRPSGIGVAMLLRLSFLEPCEDRRGLLEMDPPNRLIVLPRISFTGDGHTDNLTCAWMVWSSEVEPGIEVVKGPTKLADIEGP